MLRLWVQGALSQAFSHSPFSFSERSCCSTMASLFPNPYPGSQNLKFTTALQFLPSFLAYCFGHSGPEMGGKAPTPDEHGDSNLSSLP